MKLLLVRPDSETVYDFFKMKAKKRILPPLNLMYLASYIKSYSDEHSVNILDGECQKITPQDVKGYDIVGVGGTTPEYNQINNIFKMVKETDKDIVTVAGGVHFTALPDEDYNYIDFIITGEGEISLLDLLDSNPTCSDKTQVIQGISIDDLDVIPFPLRDIVDNDRYTCEMAGKLKKTTMMVTSRGCPYRCIFCHNSKIPRLLRFRSIDNVMNELYTLKDFNIDNIIFADETFTLKPKRLIELCNRIIHEKLNLQWSCLTRADAISHKVVSVMERAGCESISLGIESGNSHILSMCCKDETKQDMINALDVLSCYPGIEKRASYIIGHPYDTYESVMDTICFSKQLKVDRAFFNIMTPYPSSVVYDMAKEGKGLHILTEDWSEYRRYGHCVVETDSLSRDMLVELQKHAYNDFWSQPHVILYHLNKLIGNDDDKRFYNRPVLEALEEILDGRQKFIV